MKFPLPDHVIRLIAAPERKALGLKTQEEAALAAEIKSERDLHKAVGNLLRLRGIEFFESRMDRKTTRRKGEPDFLFALERAAVAWELKLPGRQLDPEQEKMFQKMSAKPNGWICRIIHSVDEALSELKRL